MSVGISFPEHCTYIQGTTAGQVCRNKICPELAHGHKQVHYKLARIDKHTRRAPDFALPDAFLLSLVDSLITCNKS